jgi:hypothetical protein
LNDEVSTRFCLQCSEAARGIPSWQSSSRTPCWRQPFASCLPRRPPPLLPLPRPLPALPPIQLPLYACKVVVSSANLLYPSLNQATHHRYLPPWA